MLYQRNNAISPTAKSKMQSELFVMRPISLLSLPVAYFQEQEDKLSTAVCGGGQSARFMESLINAPSATLCPLLFLKSVRNSVLLSFPFFIFLFFCFVFLTHAKANVRKTSTHPPPLLLRVRAETKEKESRLAAPDPPRGIT